MKISGNTILFFLSSLVFSFSKECKSVSVTGVINPQNNCINFSVGQGTGCAWMCNYCANTLGTNNYYFTTDVCKYQTGGCVGNPQVGVTYTCCSA